MAECGDEASNWTEKVENLDEGVDDLEVNEPRKNRNSILIPADSFDDIAAFLEPSVCNRASGAIGTLQASSGSINGPVNEEDDVEIKQQTDIAVDEIDEGIQPSDDTLSSTSEGKDPDESLAAEAAALRLNSERPDFLTQVSDEHCPDWQNADWRQHRKHVFILSCAGKPIYTRHGDEDQQAALFGTLLTLSQFLQHTQQEQKEKDMIRCICAGQHKFVFLPRDHMVLVIVARSKETMHSLILQLTYVYNQIISILSYSRLKAVFDQRLNFDLRRLLSGAEKFIDNLLDNMDCDPSFILSAIRCLPIDSPAREVIAQTILMNSKIQDLVFVILIAENQLITLVHLKNCLLHPVDLHMLFNLVSSSDSFKHAESWSPVCLPKFDSNGYLHAHISYLDEACQACLLLLSVNKDSFYILSDCKKKIQERLLKNGGIKVIHDSLRRRNYRVADVGIPGILHFLYKAKIIGQFTEPNYDVPYSDENDRSRLFSMYQFVYSRMHCPNRSMKILFHVGKFESILGWVTTGFELYAVFSPLVTKPAAIIAINKLLRWIKKEEDRLFIFNSNTI